MLPSTGPGMDFVKDPKLYDLSQRHQAGTAIFQKLHI